MAETLGESNHVSLLEKTLEEEKETDEKLTELAPQINTQANSGNEQQDEASSRDKKEVQASSVMPTESVFGSIGPRRFRYLRLIFRLLVPTNRYPPTVFTLLTCFRFSGRFDCLFDKVT